MLVKMYGGAARMVQEDRVLAKLHSGKNTRAFPINYFCSQVGNSGCVELRLRQCQAKLL